MVDVGYLSSLFIITIIYFRVARRLNILDKPNHRSSHDTATIRGGGIIFVIAGLTTPFITKNSDWSYLVGLFIIGSVSFWDDLTNLPGKIRFAAQVVSASLLVLSLGLSLHPLIQICIVIGCVGALNIYNFMDGINGITGTYSMVALVTLLFINEQQIGFVASDHILLPLFAVLVFLFFNFRKKAVCFAGDVGSVSIAFIIISLIANLIKNTGDIKYILLLLVYGLDGVSTILFRFLRGENLGEAHRSHLYQYLANEKKWPHLSVSVLYAVLQAIVNIAIISLPFDLVAISVALPVTFLLFVSIRFYLQGSDQLLKQI